MKLTIVGAIILIGSVVLLFVIFGHAAETERRKTDQRNLAKPNELSNPSA